MEDVAEIIALTRDIVLLLLLAVTLIVSLILYWKVFRVIGSVKRAIKDAEDIVSAVSAVSQKVVGPAAAASGLAFGLGKMAAFLTGFRRRRRKGGSKNG